MGAIVCQISDFEDAVAHSQSELFARGVTAQPERRCPHCDSIIYSRRHKFCGVCCEALPVGCIFSDEEARSIELRLNEERERHRKWLHRYGN